VLYELTTGQRPFQGEFDPQVMASIMMGRYDPPSAVVPNYPHELAIIVMRALANEPENRFASAEQMREALEKYLRGSGPQVGAPQIAALVKERCGTEMEARAASLRGETSAFGDPRMAAWAPVNPKGKNESGTGATAKMIEGRPSSPRRGILWAGIAALVGASLGIGVLSYVRTARKRPPVAIVETPSTAFASTSANAPPSPTAVGSAASTGAGTTAAGGTAQSRVHLRITPSSAIVIVDGIVLPRGTDTIAKPSDGASMNVLVRADKHEDTIVMVDSATPEEVEVTLVPNVPGRVALSATSSTTGAAGSSSATTVRPRARDAGAAGTSGSSGSSGSSGAAVIDAPPNPYD